MSARRVAAFVAGVSAVLASGAVPAHSAPPAPQPVATVVAEVETPPVLETESNGDADDPAVWVDRARPARSLVLGTLKEAGLAVYRLDGSLVQSVPPVAGPADAPPSRFNNVDVLRDIRIGGRRLDLAVVSDRGLDRIRSYAIEPRRGAAPLRDVTAPGVPLVFAGSVAEVAEQATAYGITGWRDPRTGTGYVFVTQRHGLRVAAFRLVAAGGGRVSYVRVGEVALPAEFRLPDGTTWRPCEEPGELPQSEAMVVDPDRRVLYVAQEDVGIWRLPLRLDGARPVLVDRVREYGVPAAYDPETEECAPSGPDPGYGGRHLTADAEGLTLYDAGHGRGYLLASSQGDSTFAVYRRDTLRWIGQFGIAGGRGSDGRRIDGAQHSDGAAVVPIPLGPRFPHGLLVVHDGENTPAVADPGGEPVANTDFKLVRWDRVAAALGLRP